METPKIKIALRKESLMGGLMDIIERTKLDDKQIITHNGLVHLEKEINLENKDLFCKDVSYALNLCVELLIELETLLSKDDKEEVDDICNLITQGKELEVNNYSIGQLVNYEGLAYQIGDIDYDDFTLYLDDGNDLMGGNGFDVSPTEIDNSKVPKDYIEYLKPIIEDVKDGEPNLTQSCVDGLMKVIRAKIEFNEGLITEIECMFEINKAYD